MAYLGLADSLKGMQKIDKAIEAYSKVIELDAVSQSVGLMKRGLLYMQLKQNDKALTDFNLLVTITEENPHDSSTSLSKAYFYKAKALKKLNNMNDSVIYFE